MGLVAKEGGGNRELLPAEMLQAVCYGVIDLGTQETSYGNKQKACVLFEIPSLRFETEDGKDLPKGKNKWYAVSLHEKSNMGKDLASWRGKPFTAEEKKGFDVSALIGANCLVQIVHETGNDGVVRDNIKTITPLMQGMTKLEPENAVINYSISDNGFNFDGIPEWAEKIIKESLEYKCGQQPVPKDTTDYSQDVGDQSIPF